MKPKAPFVGAFVRYGGKNQQMHPAMVTGIDHPDGRVDLSVVWDDGMTEMREFVEYAPPRNGDTRGGWCWPEDLE